MRDPAPSPQLIARLIACALAVSGCDEMPPPSDAPTPRDSAAASASASSGGPEASDGQRLFAAATTYASRCLLFEYFVDPTYDLCTRVEHCPASVKSNFKKAPCGFTEEERRAAVEGGKRATKLLETTPVEPQLATFLKHVELFGQWVDDTTDIGGCLERSPYGEYYCYERTRGTLAMYQDLATAYYAWRPAKDDFVLPRVYSSLHGAPPYRPLSDEVRRHGLRWGRCPSGICIISDQMQWEGGW